MSRSFVDLKREVIDVGLCLGCGACVGVCPWQALRMDMVDHEREDPEPVLLTECKPNDDCACYYVCPGRDVPLRELDRMVFGRERELEKEPLGIYRRCVNGYTRDVSTRGLSAVAAMTSTLLACAIESRIVDACIVVGMDKEHPWRCKSILVDDPSQVHKRMRSTREVVPTLDILYQAVIEKGKEKIGVTGLPCQIHALRKLQKLEKPRELAQSIRLSISTFCVGKAYYVGLEHWLKEIVGISDFEEILALDYWPDQGALAATTRDGKTHIYPSRGHGYGAFFPTRDRCEVCVDFTGDLADASVGNISQLGASKKAGWFAALVRTELGEDVVEQAIQRELLYVETHEPSIPTSGSCAWEVSKHHHVAVLEERAGYGWPVPDFEYAFQVTITPRTRIGR